ncbi:hypothetical protein L208DRAFT_1401917 [Tricholoma matsutake]|nr:hypothetical protein L208DRAFT_1401917 [Tricholoma matsutake 945]
MVTVLASAMIQMLLPLRIFQQLPPGRIITSSESVYWAHMDASHPGPTQVFPAVGPICY